MQYGDGVLAHAIENQSNQAFAPVVHEGPSSGRDCTRFRHQLRPSRGELTLGLPVDDSRISDAERQLGVTFPVELRQRLRSNNGGEIQVDGEEWSLHPVWDPTNRRTATRSTNHVVKETEQARAWPLFPPGAVAIASDGSGDILVLRNGVNRLELWLHESGEIVNVDVEW